MAITEPTADAVKESFEEVLSGLKAVCYLLAKFVYPGSLADEAQALIARKTARVEALLGIERK
jgi:hypothetical protein